jgi:hypothetical protein
MFKYSCLNPGMGATIRSLSKLAPHTLALMHGPSGDGATALRALADDYDRLSDQALPNNRDLRPRPPLPASGPSY